MNIDQAIFAIEIEHSEAIEHYPKFNSPHEGLAVLQEEFEELKAEVFKSHRSRSTETMRKEAIQGIVYFRLKLGKRLLYPLNKMIRRIKRNMDTLMVALGGFCFPTGLGILVVGREDKDAMLTIVGIIIAFLGLCAWAWAFKLTISREIRNKAEIISIVANIKMAISELKGLREDLGKTQSPGGTDDKRSIPDK